MTYRLSAALQSAIFDRLSNDPDVDAAFGGAVFDTPPAGELPSLYLTIGSEDVTARDDKSGSGAVHRLALAIVASNSGFFDAKSAAGLVETSLTRPGPWLMDQGRIVDVRFSKARAHQDRSGQTRRIDLQFRVRVDDES